ncbi:methylmalonyl Co-A mutase-associated GTPase MeaB [Raineyella sp.]|uniref:methylmalonyl Co-A mutase-associated GTPase MeaB n=1 Tax=Raineyella sp. TaxID=1911550 RepID=UPI002B21A64E|nr:methylmalonyl Co-A mutase-associated GTPase MeaB [Raineyella sp.]MEA5155241.1 methylmalonyl Co-A mutase-associated GTPase MeaB [Raineyella sp.]
MPELIEGARQRKPRALGRLITLIENNSASLRQAMELMAPDTGHCHIVGITGSPGVGKSTSTSALVTELRTRGQRVGVLAVDPSSPFSGGAVLGDRIRMQKHSLDPDVYIRSMATRGHLGGLSAAAPQALRVFDTAGFDTVIVETVGVGQSEVEITQTADTVLVLNAPGMGDAIQAAKAGILEIADIFVVNKADRDGTQSLVRELRNMVALAKLGPDDWKPPIVRTVASQGEGISELVDQIEAHREHAQKTEAWQARRLDRARAEVEALALGNVRQRFLRQGRAHFDAIAADVRDGRTDPYAAADAILEDL